MKKSNHNFRYLYQSYKRRAKRKGYDFSLTEEEFARLTKQSCAYCGEPPHQAYVHDARYSEKPYIYNGIDRIDNDGPYSTTNSTSSCRWCNQFKSVRSKRHMALHILQLVQDAIKKAYDVDLPRYVFPEEVEASSLLQLSKADEESDSDDEPQG